METKGMISSEELREYFESCESLMSGNKRKDSKKKLLSYFESIKQEFVSVTKQVGEDNCLSSMHHPLILDAKLQILFFFWLDENNHFCTEEGIIKMSETDYRSYYNEMIVVPNFGSVPKPLILI